MSNFSGRSSPGLFSVLASRWCWFGLVVALIAGATQAEAAERWSYVRTENFELLSQASEKKTRKLVTELEQFRASFIAAFHLRPAHEPRVTVVLFDSAKRFTPFKPLYNGKPKEVAGLLRRRRGRDHDRFEPRYRAGTRNPARRRRSFTSMFPPPAAYARDEAAHLVERRAGRGLLDVFASIATRSSTGARSRSISTCSVSGPLMPIGQMMAVTEQSSDYNEDERAGMFYAQAWALSHFLVCGEDRTNAAKLAKFLAATDADPSNPEATFEGIFGFNFAELEQMLRNYLQSGRYFHPQAARSFDRFRKPGGVSVPPATKSATSR